MQLKRTKWCSLLFLTIARNMRKKTINGTNWPLWYKLARGPACYASQ